MVLGGTCRIGVLGGIGPEASAKFYKIIIEKLQKKGLIKRNEDYPQIIINSIPAPELTSKQVSEEDIEQYISGLKELDFHKPDFIVMVCNTIHLFHEEFQKRVNTPILDLREELKKLLFVKNVKEVLVIGTPITIKNDLYKFQNIKTLYPNKKEIRILSDAIFNFNRGFRKSEQIDVTKKICEKYLKKGVDAIILGCTEFAVMLENEDIPKINSIEVLVDATINHFLNNKFYIKQRKGDVL